MAQNVTEQEVEVRTPDGVADCVLYRSDRRTSPPVIHYPDGIGTRPSQRQMARRVASEGYDVLLPNIYYRAARPPFFEGKFDFANEKMRARFMELTSSLPPDAMDRDAVAYAAFLSSDGPMGVVGYCFTGKFALRTAAALPDRVVAAASFHGGGLITDDASSPHRVLPRVKARLYFGHARDDRSMPAEAIARLDAALEEWGGKYETETYDALHGWTVPDSQAYNEAEAERAYSKLRALFAAKLH